MVILFWFIFAVQSAIVFLNQSTCPDTMLGYQYTEVKSEETFLVTLSINTTHQTVQYQPVGGSKVIYTYAQFVSSTEISQLRSPSKQVYSNGNFITFSEKRVYLHSNFNVSYFKQLNLSCLATNQIISEVCVGQDPTKTFVITYNSTSYYVLVFNLTNLVSRMNLGISQRITKLICRNNKLFILYLNGVSIYTLNQSPTLLRALSFPISTRQNIDMQIQLTAHNKNLTLYNMTSNTAIQKQISNNITGIELMYPYVVIITNNTLEQYDYSTGILLLIGNISHNLPTFVYRLFRLCNDTLVVSRDFLISPYLYPTIYYFAITPCYTYTLSTPCSSLYTLSLNGKSCCKNASIPMIKPELSEQQLMLDQNSIASTFDTSDRSQYAEMVLKSISSVFVVSSFKLTPQLLLALITVIDDISYYQYHLKSYPNSVKFFTTNLDIINSAKLNISIIEFMQKIKAKTTIATKQNEHLINYLNVSTLADEDIYFQRSFVQNYRNCILINLFLFCLLNAVTFGIYVLSFKFKGIKGVFLFFWKNSKWWIFISSFMETTFSRGCFDFGVQFLLPSSENFREKLNISACFSLLFLIITYACNFYPLLFSFSNKKSAKLISIPSKMNTFSYLSISHFILLRTLSRTLVHSTLLTSYTKQIFSLFFIDIIVILLCIRFRHSFYNLLIFTFYLTQMIAFCAFDLFFFLQQSEMLPMNHRRQLVSLILILVILFSSILISFVLFATSLKSICATIIKKIKNMKIKNIDMSPKQRGRQKKTTKENKKATIEIKSAKKTSVAKIRPNVIKETIGQKQNRVIFKIKENRVKEKQKGKIKKVRCNLQLNLQKMIRQH